MDDRTYRHDHIIAELIRDGYTPQQAAHLFLCPAASVNDSGWHTARSVVMRTPQSRRDHVRDRACTQCGRPITADHQRGRWKYDPPEGVGYLIEEDPI